MEALGYNPDSLEILLIQMITLLRNDQVVKMSKRQGTSVTIKELVEAVDVEAIRYYFLMQSPDSPMDFDIEATKKKSSENPIYYIQYAHARISSLLKTAEEKGISDESSIKELSEIEIELLQKLDIFNDVILEATEKRLPHIFTNYIYNIATLYHKYYNMEKVFTEDEDAVAHKILMAKAVQKVIAEGLLLIGITPKKEM